MDLQFLHRPRRRKARAIINTASLLAAGGVLVYGPAAHAQTDTTAPQLTYTTPAINGAVSALPAVSGTIQDEAGGSGPDRVEFGLFRNSDRRWWNGSAWVDTFATLTTTISGNTWSRTAGLPAGGDLPQGTYVVVGSAFDVAGNRASLDNFFTVDTAAPGTINFTTPTNGEILNRITAINGNVSDNPSQGAADSGIVSVDVTLRRNSDGNYWTGSEWVATPTRLSATVTGTFWSLDVAFPAGANALDGAYTLAATATDRAGNQAQNSITFTILGDTTAPALAFVAPQNNAIQTALPAVRGTVTEENGGSGLDRVELGVLRLSDNRWWNGSSWVTTFQSLPTVLSSRGGTTFWQRTGGLPAGANLPDGQYVLAAVSFDRIGNRRQVDATIRIDNTAPATLTFTRPANGSRVGSLAPIQGTVIDAPNGGGIASVSLQIRRSSDGRYWNGSVWTTTPALLETVINGNTWSRAAGPEAINLLQGTYILTASALDNAGNRRTVAAGVRVVDDEAPTVTISTPANGALAGSLTAITGTAVDNNGGSGLARVILTIRRSSDGRYWNGSDWFVSSSTLTTTVSGQTWTRNTALPTGANLASDNYFVTALAYDRSGNRSVAVSSVRIIADAVAPTARFVRPAPGASVRNITPVRVNATDNVGGSGVAGVQLAIFRNNDELWWNGRAWTDTFALLDATSTGGGTWTVTNNLPSGSNLPSGLYVLVAQVFDRVGNRASFDNTIAVDPNAPANNSVATSASSLAISTSSAQAATGSVQIDFEGRLNPDSARDSSHYNVRVNGREVGLESVGVSANGGSITLVLAAGSLSAGDSVEVSWTSISDSAGREIAGNTTVMAR